MILPGTSLFYTFLLIVLGNGGEHTMPGNGEGPTEHMEARQSWSCHGKTRDSNGETKLPLLEATTMVVESDFNPQK